LSFNHSAQRAKFAARAFALICCVLATGCWRSEPGFFDLSSAVQPIAAGTYTETNLSGPKPAPGEKAETHPVILTSDGNGYRAQWGLDGEMEKVFLVPLRARGPQTLIYEAQDASCAAPNCGGGAPPVYVGILRIREDGAIERIEPDKADPDLLVAKANGGTCDDEAECIFKDIASLKSALEKLADQPASYLYTAQ
jgi:hypothetical protein